MPYLYGLLNPNISGWAREHNNGWLGPNTLGIEVTSIIHAKRCGLGNIDPQHTQGRSSSAAEEAIMYHLPPRGSKLVTERSDKDALAAMAIITLRLQGQIDRVDKILVAMVGALDRHGAHEAITLYPELFEMRQEVVATDALNIVAMVESERWPTLEKRVKDTMRILCGEMPSKEVRQIIAMKDRRPHHFTAEQYDGITYVRAPGGYSKAREWAVRQFPVTVVEDPLTLHSNNAVNARRRVTLVRQSLAAFDRDLFEKLVNEAEAQARHTTLNELERRNLKWGGPLNIVSSPQGSGRETVLPTVTILQSAHACLLTVRT